MIRTLEYAMVLEVDIFRQIAGYGNGDQKEAVVPSPVRRL